MWFFSKDNEGTEALAPCAASGLWRAHVMGGARWRPAARAMALRQTAACRAQRSETREKAVSAVGRAGSAGSDARSYATPPATTMPLASLAACSATHRARAGAPAAAVAGTIRRFCRYGVVAITPALSATSQRGDGRNGPSHRTRWSVRNGRRGHMNGVPMWS